MTGTTSAAQGSPQRYKRSFKNYLIDSRFQLKYTGMILFVTVVIAGVLGFIIYKTSREVVEQTRDAIAEGKEASAQSRVASMVVQENAKSLAGDEPEFMEEMKKATDEIDAKYKQRIGVLESKEKAVGDSQKTMLLVIAASLGAMVVLIGILGIYFTHKVAGPIFKMKRLLRQVGEGKLTFEGRLRKGDELQDFFETFATMVESLRERQRKEIEQLERAIEIAQKSGASAESVARVVLVRDEMKRALEV